MFKHLLVPHDGSDYANEALHVAAELACALDARLDICNVVDVARIAGLTGAYPVSLQPAVDALEFDGAAILQTAAESVRPKIEARTYLLSGFPAKEIAEWAGLHAVDLIVMGSHGRSGMSRMFVGSVTEDVMRRSPSAILVTRQPRLAKTDRPTEKLAAV